MSDPIFQKSLQDLVKGIRAHKKDPSPYISQAIAEIKIELRSTDPFLKAEAVRKLTYLQTAGYNVSWASFAIVEVMSQSRFAHKRIGYLAANQSFTEATDVILLTTNLFKKEFTNTATTSQYEIGLAINCLANIATKDLARDCISDLVGLMTHTRPYVRKKAVLAMYKLFVKFPQGLRLTFDKLKDCLDDSESSVISCAVNVICELANKNPKNYLAMAPKFFRLLTTSSNNWMLIKVVKLLGSLVTEEPRLARKLLEPLATIIQNTGAKSLQFECIFTITEALPFSKRDDGTDAKCAPMVVQLCSDYLKGFIEDQDQNLKYLGLVGLVNLMKSNPRSVVDHRDLILKCLNDEDVTIRIRTLELLSGIVSKKSLVDLVHHLLEHAVRSEGHYRDEIIAKVLYMCSKDKYALLTDFAWYMSILLRLAVMPGAKHGKQVSDHLIEISLRVDTVRPFAVESMLTMLLNDALILGNARLTVSEVLKAAAWIVGEYSDISSLIAADREESPIVDEDGREGYWIRGPSGEEFRSRWRGREVQVQVIGALLHPRATNLPAAVQSAYIQAATKMFIRSCSECEEAVLATIVGTVRSQLGVFLQSSSIEVQERATCLRHIIADFDILPINWQAAAEEEQREAEESIKHKEFGVFNLLDMPTYTSGSVQAVDNQGARQAKMKAHVLAAATAEQFYAVHSKAQRKVPVPEGLNLETPINNSALNKLLNVVVPENMSLTSLSFVSATAFAAPTYDPDNSSLHGYGSRDKDEDSRLKNLSQSLSDGVSEGGGGGAYGAYSGDHGSMRGGMSVRNKEDDMFYLSSAGDGHKKDQIIPLSQILADTFEEKKSHKSKGGKSGKKGKKHSEEAEAAAAEQVAVDTREMLPAGAVSSDDEGATGGRKSGGKKHSGSSKKSATKISSISQKNRDDLESVDITTPLRADEVFAVQRHREVPVLMAPSSATVVSDLTEHDKSDKKKKKSKHSSSKHDKHGKHDSSSKSKKAAVEGDLLSFDWANTPQSSSAGTGMLGGGGGGGFAAVADVFSAPTSTHIHSSHAQSLPHSSSSAGKDKDKSNHSHSKASSSAPWALLHRDVSADVLYSLELKQDSGPSTAGTIKVFIKVLNTQAVGANVSVDLIMGNTQPYRLLQSPSMSVVKHLAPRGEAQMSFDLAVDNVAGAGAAADLAQLGCSVRITKDSMLGGETTASANAVIKVYPCLFFLSNKLSEAGFAALLGKSSSRWAGATARVGFATVKLKTALKIISKHLHAHVVEGEIARAASMCAKTNQGGNVCCLGKVSKDGAQIVVDIKCLCGTKPESQQLAESIAQSIQELVF